MAPRKRSPPLYPRHRALYPSGKRAVDRRFLSVYMALVFFLLFGCLFLSQLVSDAPGAVLEPLDPGLLEEMFRPRSPSDERSPLGFPDSSEYDPPANVNMSTLFKMAESKPDHWQRVRRTNDRFYVFSAYLDTRRARAVRIIAAARTRLTDRVVCRLFWKTTDGREFQATTVLASNKLIRENWNLRYSAFFLLCPLPPGMTGETPLWVSVQRLNDRALPRNVLLVHRRDQHPRPPEELAVCVKPIHYDYNKVLQFAEFVELNLALGVSHFVLYNHTVGPDVGCLLERYVSERLVTLLPWQLPIASQREIRTEALFAALNDCLYRTMHAFRWVAMIDLDEFIVPAGNITLPAMLRRLHAAHQRAGAYSFRNAFFYLQWPDDPTTARDRLPLVTMRKTLRKAHLHAHRQRSKCILEPESVVEVGNHFVWEFLAGKATVNVASSVAFLHHYRVCEFGGNDCVNATSVRDARLHFWKPRLLEAVGRRMRMLRRRDLACPGRGNGTAARRSSPPGRS
ncbi:beta-1,4-galactosyltransferase galt-1 [Ixodes scapularis]